MNVVKTIHLMYEVENVMETMDKSNILNCELKKNVSFFLRRTWLKRGQKYPAQVLGWLIPKMYILFCRNQSRDFL
jgi:hypothetical protein